MAKKVKEEVKISAPKIVSLSKVKEELPPLEPRVIQFVEKDGTTCVILTDDFVSINNTFKGKQQENHFYPAVNLQKKNAAYLKVTPGTTKRLARLWEGNPIEVFIYQDPDMDGDTVKQMYYNAVKPRDLTADEIEEVQAIWDASNLTLEKLVEKFTEFNTK